jgi:lysyl-tRNA synthetase class 2
MSSPDTTQPEPKSGGLEASRREKIRRLEELGVDPWGSRFDDHMAIGSIRDRAEEIRYQTEDGRDLELPDLDDEEARKNFRQWKSDQGKGELSGPQVRAAGRIVGLRDTGKLIFLEIRDWSGDIQLFIGKKQVGEDNWAVAQCFDYGDLIGVDGRFGRTNTGELTIFAEKLTFLCKSIEPPPEKYHGLTDPELRQRMRYLDLTYGEGVRERKSGIQWGLTQDEIEDLYDRIEELIEEVDNGNVATF